MVKFDSSSNIKSFNTAKLYTEEVLFPKMDLFQKFQRQADFGDADLNNSIELPEDLRDIQRFNGLKGMNDVLYSLLVNVSSTVRLRNKKEEVEMLNKLLNLTISLKKLFHENKKMFFKISVKGGNITEVLDMDFFYKVKKAIDNAYINTEILMTKNKLLFVDESDEYETDKEVIEKIKQEYAEL